ncbi:MAG: hypothetical protein MZU95_05585 [Desulfomicrobium escambiense]|nr:hypothetical protein [Desulfomicrobium escambiense]
MTEDFQVALMVTLGGVIIDVLDFRENVLAKSFKSDCVKLSQDLPIWFFNLTQHGAVPQYANISHHCFDSSKIIGFRHSRIAARYD